MTTTTTTKTTMMMMMEPNGIPFSAHRLAVPNALFGFEQNKGGRSRAVGRRFSESNFVFVTHS